MSLKFEEYCKKRRREDGGTETTPDLESALREHWPNLDTPTRNIIRRSVADTYNTTCAITESDIFSAITMAIDEQKSMLADWSEFAEQNWSIIVDSLRGTQSKITGKTIRRTIDDP